MTQLTVNAIDNRRALLPLLVILVLAAWLRMGDLARVTSYQFDQAQLSLLAMEMIDGERFPLTGITSSAGLPNSPMTVYVLALPYLFTDNPQIVTLMIGAWNVFGVGLLWYLAYRYFTPTIALVAGLAYALHPFAVYYGRSIWAQDFHTPIILLGLLFALRGFWEGRRWAQTAALPVLLIGIQIHYAAWTLLPVYLWVVWRGRRAIAFRSLGASVILGMLTLVPFGLGLLQAGESAAASAVDVGDRLDSLVARDKALIYAARLATGLGGPWVGMPTVGNVSVWLDFPNPVTYLWLIVGVSVVGGLVLVWSHGREWALLMWLWAVLPIAVFVPNWTGVFPHYFVPNLPAFALLSGVAVAALAGTGAIRKAVLLAVFSAILLTQGLQFWGFLRFAGATNTNLQSTPVNYLLAARAELRQHDDIVIVGATPSDSGYFIWYPLLREDARCIRELVIADGGVALFPAQQFAVVTPPGALDPATGDLYHTSDPTLVAMRGDEEPYRIDLFESAPAWAEDQLTEIAPAQFDNGVSLTGYRLTDERIYLAWRLPGRGEQGYSYFAHFLNAAGEKVGQRDASYYPARFWCQDDRLITWVDAEVPADTATLRVGMYIQQNDFFYNASLLDDAGNPVGLWVDIPLTAATN